MNHFTHQPKSLVGGQFVHPMHTPKLWHLLWDAARQQPWYTDGVTYVGNADGWFYFQLRGVTSGFARVNLKFGRQS